MRVGIIGASGFIGSRLAKVLAARGDEVIGFSRRGHMATAVIREWRTLDLMDLAELDAVVNLAGEPVDQRWTPERKLAFRKSRVGVTEDLVRAVRRRHPAGRPKVLVNASAVGYYGDRGDTELDESAQPGEGFLAELCQEWEAALEPLGDTSVRTVVVRIGVVLGEGGAALEKLRKVFSKGLGGKLGNGQQWMPWIHIEDLVGAIAHAIGHQKLVGPVNAVAPEPVRNEEFTAKFAKALRRPALLSVPEFALKIALGEFSSALLASERVVPAALLASGYAFHYPSLDGALRDLLRPGGG
jgi:uncharacterized protein (TIGR01777 family)